MGRSLICIGFHLISHKSKTLGNFAIAGAILARIEVILFLSEERLIHLLKVEKNYLIYSNRQGV